MPTYDRPIRARYLDPLELIWMSTARRLGLTVRRDPNIFSMTDGRGLLALGPRADLDPDDNAAQMILHELCHWITNGVESFHREDWGFGPGDLVDWREYACLRLQASLGDRMGSRQMWGPTGDYRVYYDQIGDPLAPLDGSDLEARIVRRAADAIEEANGHPWGADLRAAITATRQLHEAVQPFLSDYQSDVHDDTLPSLWGR